MLLSISGRRCVKRQSFQDIKINNVILHLPSIVSSYFFPFKKYSISLYGPSFQSIPFLNSTRDQRLPHSISSTYLHLTVFKIFIIFSMQIIIFVSSTYLHLTIFKIFSKFSMQFIIFISFSSSSDRFQNTHHIFHADYHFCKFHLSSSDHFQNKQLLALF